MIDTNRSSSKNDLQVCADHHHHEIFTKRSKGSVNAKKKNRLALKFTLGIATSFCVSIVDIRVVYFFSFIIVLYFQVICNYDNASQKKNSMLFFHACELNFLSCYKHGSAWFELEISWNRRKRLSLRKMLIFGLLLWKWSKRFF